MKLFHTALLLSSVAVPVVALVLWQRLDRAVPRPTTGPWNRPLAERVGDPFPRVYVNAAGDRVEVAAPPQRIVSATIFSDAVLLDACPPERVLALHHISKDPQFSPIADASSRFPRHTGGGVEDILALRPDLVVVSSFSRKEVCNLLSRDGCAVVRFLGFTSLEDIENNIRALGYLLGLDRPAEKIVADMREELGTVAARGEARRAWRVLHYSGGNTSGSETTFDALLQQVGARNAALELAVRGFVAISAERVLLLDPDALIVGFDPGGEERTRQAIRQMPGFNALAAVREDRLLFVPNSWLMSTSHHVTLAAVRIAEVLDRWGPR